MSKPFTIVIREDRDRRFALDAVRRAAFGMAVVVDKPKRTTEQNKRLWSMIQAIVDAKTIWGGRELEPEDWYDLLWSAFLRTKKLETGTTLKGIEGEVITVGQFRPSKSNTVLFAEWSDMVLAFIDTRGIPWKDRAPPREEER